MIGEISPLGRGLRTGLDTDPAYHSIVPPLYPSTNYSFAEPGKSSGYEYSRTANPTRDQLGAAIATLEAGAHGIVTASGLAALTTALTALLPSGGRLIVPHDCYGGSWRLFNQLAGWAGFQVDHIDQTNLPALAQALREPADLMLIETPSNPLLRLVDLAEAIALAHRAGATVLVDNTFCSPIRQRPIDFGADVVMHSTTKFINGHSDVVGGALVARTAAHGELLAHWANLLGVTGSAWDGWLTLRGLRTLDARVRVHDANAAALVELLQAHPQVARLYYPGLPGHPGHRIAARQQSSFGSMIAFELAGGRRAVEACCRGLQVFCLAESLGGGESLIAHPASMTHAAMSPQAQRAAGISAGMLRVSAGIEPAIDLVDDLRAGLDRAHRVR